MSLQTWKDEFYPVEADAVSVTDAAAHSLRKWEGLRPEHMERHGMSWVQCAIDDGQGGRLNIDVDSCALCEHHYGLDDDGDDCPGCPLAAVRNDVACCVARSDEAVNPYALATARDLKHNVKPMILELQRAVAYVNNMPAGE